MPDETPDRHTLPSVATLLEVRIDRPRGRSVSGSAVVSFPREDDA